tara:strand:+ start:3358 stop:4428 length:1071 start_codon:yes stop_codon:yes gene_type:complete
MELSKSPLHDEHVSLGAKLVEFGGWQMPISYPTGTLEEHHQCRNSCVIFDVSHLGSVQVRGERALSKLQYVFTNNLEKINPGQAQYSHLLNEMGHVVDDVIIWWLAKDHFEIMPNASNTERVESALRASGTSIELENITRNRAIIAVQGPDTKDLLRKLSVEISQINRFYVSELTISGWPITVAGTGYTGEQGVEISIPTAGASELWNILASLGCMPAGLGARDTLRLEAGFPLHGHELGEGISPVNANLKWVVSMDKGDFIGREALITQMQYGPERILRGLETSGRRPPRHGQEIVLNGKTISKITSGNFSPTLGRGIAMAYLPVEIEIGSDIIIRGNKSEVAAQVCNLPFYTSK